MAHGGKRQGAGRKQGAPARIDAEARKRAAESGKSAVEIMTEMMNAEYEAWLNGADNRDEAKRCGGSRSPLEDDDDDEIVTLLCRLLFPRREFRGLRGFLRG